MSQRSRIFRGIGASPGVAVGNVFLVDGREVRFRRYHIEADQVSYEVDRLRDAVDQSVLQLETIRNKLTRTSHDHDAILEAHEMMLRDPIVADEAIDHIRTQQLNAEWAVSKVIGRLRSAFDRLADPYFRERRSDIDFVRDRIIRNLTGQSADLSDLEHLAEGTVLVAHELSPVDAALLSRHRVTGFVTEVGGKTSHTAIIARSLDVPAVVGAPGILDAVGSGDAIVVDGSQGEVTLRPARNTIDEARSRGNRYRIAELELIEAQSLPAITVDGRELTISGNIELPSEIASVLERGGEGIGLYRTEFLFLGRTTPPDEEEHYRSYCQVFEAAGERTVTIRTLDVGGEKLFGALDYRAEVNPALGLRAIRYCLHHPSVFEPQLAGLLRAATRGDARLMLPMVSAVEEIERVREIIETISMRLSAEGKEHRADLPLGVMIEIPSAAIVADQLAPHCDFFSIGTNDLLQFLLAVDRNNERVDYLYDSAHPAVLRVLKSVASAASQAEIPVAVCGEMAGDLDAIPLLLGLGFDELSMNAGAIPRVKRLIRELRHEDSVYLLQSALECTSSTQVHSLIADFFESKHPLALENEST